MLTLPNRAQIYTHGTHKIGDFLTLKFTLQHSRRRKQQSLEENQKGRHSDDCCRWFAECDSDRTQLVIVAAMRGTDEIAC